MANVGNQGRFTLRLLNIGIIPVSWKLKNAIRTPKGYHTIRKAERQLLNERIRCTNNTLYVCGIKLFCVLERATLNVCWAFINKVRKVRYSEVMETQKSKFNRLWLKYRGGCLNIHSSQDHSSNFGGLCRSISVAAQTPATIQT